VRLKRRSGKEFFPLRLVSFNLLLYFVKVQS
jgi:hypothetical protein